MSGGFGQDYGARVRVQEDLGRAAKPEDVSLGFGQGCKARDVIGGFGQGCRARGRVRRNWAGLQSQRMYQEDLGMAAEPEDVPV